MLVQPATVTRWHREGFRGCWSRRSRRRPGRPCIDLQLRALIRRMAAENRLWGAPRIHGELLKLGFGVSERTVSRYLRDRLTAPSQTWRTFLANHLGNLAFTSMVPSSYAPSDDDDVHACGLPLRLAWSLRDGPCASNQGAVVDWPSSLQGMSLGWRIAQNHLHRRAPRRPSSGKDPPTPRAVARGPAAYGRSSFHPHTPAGSPDAESSSAVLSLSPFNRVVNVVGVRGVNYSCRQK